MRFNSKDYDLIQAVTWLDSERLNKALGNMRFIEVTNIDFIGEFFGVNLNNIYDEFQELKDTKYKFEEFCDLCDEEKEDGGKLLSEVFEYLEIQRFAEMIIKEVAESLQERLNRVL